ncbi:MBL fold metallo-hydrolase [Listeria costaricensis]|uniref:MBL fold metallo-hydrolase n=1 Tax=Listeria costaricensis TaxID=2026604 RepID=UPI000C07042D|nr:MBL fold metallo-hydrolase [Listeria costaricensis]
MKLTVFGHWGGYPLKNDGTSSYLLEEDGFKLLIDVGASAVSIMQNYVDPAELDAVILSHYHPDHVADVGILQHVRLLGNHEKRLPVLPIYAHEEDERGFSYLTMKDISEARTYHETDTLEVGPFSISFLRTIHPVPCFAMRFTANGKSIVYTADSAYQESFVRFSEQADFLFADTNFFKEMAGKSRVHMASVEVGRLAKLASVKKLMLTHLPQNGSLAQLKNEAAAEFDGEILLAEKGLSITI